MIQDLVYIWCVQVKQEHLMYIKLLLFADQIKKEQKQGLLN